MWSENRIKSVLDKENAAKEQQNAAKRQQEPQNRIKPERERNKRHPGQQEIRAVGSRRRKGQQEVKNDNSKHYNDTGVYIVRNDGIPGRVSVRFLRRYEALCQ